MTHGSRCASFFALLFDLDMAINQVNHALPDHLSVAALTSCYHNLLRRWADAS